ncbi:MAG TPA: hypothetical protein VFR99_09475 [Marmoricola sp.]|nr:hypothetical protein [Marmoricola sp.]
MTTTTTTAVAEAAAEKPSDEGSFTHWYCCVEDRGICGTKLSGEEVHDDEPAECVVCRAMEDQPCEVTCHPWLREGS